MTAIIVTDCRYVVGPDGVVRAQGAFSADVISRYVDVFGSVEVVARMRSSREVRSDLSVASGVGIQFKSTTDGIGSLGPLGQVVRACWHVCFGLQARDGTIAIVRLPSVVSVAVATALALMGKKYIAEVLGCARDLYWWHGSSFARLLAYPTFLATRAVVRRAGGVTYVTSRFLQERYPSDSKCFSGSDCWPSEVQSVWQPPDGEKFVIGSIGQLEGRVKGFDLLIDAVARSRARDIVEVRFLGRGRSEPLRALATSQGINDQVVFDGTVPKGEPVFEWLRSLSLYVQPSRSEGLPRSVIEAMTCGLPVVVAGAGGMPELVESSAIFKAEDASDLARLIDRAVVDPDWLEAMAHRNHTVAAEIAASRVRDDWIAFMKDVSA